MTNIRDLIEPCWAVTLKNGPVNLGLDVGSTVNKMSNPSAITVTEAYQGIYWQRLVIRFKTTELDVIIAALGCIIDSIPAKQRGTLMIDSSNERFAARAIKRALAGMIRVRGIAGQNTVYYLGEKSDAKTAMGAAYLRALEDGIIAMPPAKWLEKDHRLVTRNGSRFDADVDAAGNHADTFDSGKLSYWPFVEKGLKSGEWVPAPTSSFLTDTKKGCSAADQQRAQLAAARRSALNGMCRRYLST